MKLLLNSLVLVVLISGCLSKPDDKKSSTDEAPPAQNVNADDKKPTPATVKTLDEVIPPKPVVSQACKSKDPGKENVDFVYLDQADAKEMAQVVEYYFEAHTATALSPYVPEGRAGVVKASFDGKIGKSEFNVELSDCEKLDFKNVKLQVEKEGRGGHGEFSIVAVCIGAKCDKVFATVHIHEKSETVYNWPLVFKKVGDKYLPAYQKKGVDYTGESEEIPDPPQFKAQKQLEEHYYKNGDATLKLIKDEMRKKDAVYSGLFFRGLAAPAIDTEIKVQDGKIQYKVAADFMEKFIEEQKIRNRKDMLFEGSFDIAKPYSNFDIVNKKGALQAAPYLEIYPVEAEKLFLIMFVDPGFDSPLHTSSMGGHGIAVLACSALIESGTTFHSCVLISSSDIAGMVALESKADGPIWVKDGEIIKSPPSAPKPLGEKPPNPGEQKINPETGEPYTT